MNKRVLHVYLHTAGGVPAYNSFEYRFMHALSKKYETYVLFLASSGKINPTIMPALCKSLVLRTGPWSIFPKTLTWTLRTIRNTILLRQAVNGIRPDLVIGNWITRGNALSCALLHVHPFLAMVWGSDIQLEAQKSRILRLFARFTLGRADGVVVDCEFQRMKAIQLGCPDIRIYRFPWGIDTDLFHPGNNERIVESLGWSGCPIIISTRNHEPIYNIDCLIRALSKVLSNFPNAKLLLLGSGTLTASLEQLARCLGTRDMIQFAGALSSEQISEYLRASDVYVSTALSDGTSASMLEAMSSGLPVVVTDISGNREWVSNLENGCLFQPRDPDQLADQIITVLTDVQLRKRMGARNRKLALEKADWKKNVVTFYEAIDGACGGRGVDKELL